MKVYLIGIGMGNPDTLTMGAARAIRESDLLIGASRLLEPFEELGIPTRCHVTAREIEAAIRSSQAEQVSVLLSGDTGFYSGAKRLCQALTEWEVEVLPGISSLSYFCAKLHTAWQDAHVISCHGREGGLVGAVQSHEKTFVLTGGAYKADTLCRRLTEAGLGKLRAWAGENLSYESERIVSGTVEELGRQSFADLTVLLIENANPIKPVYQSAGLPDSAFLRGNVPMTKEEVRTLAVSKLRLERSDVVWDVGAGTGSVSVECALALPEGRVYAIERNPEGVDLIGQNRAQFDLVNLQIVPGHAPEVLEDLPAPDKVFVGGSGGELEEIIGRALEKNPEVRIVVSAITLETLQKALQLIERWNFRETELIQVSVARARAVGGYHMLRGENPIYLISMEKPR